MKFSLAIHRQHDSWDTLLSGLCQSELGVFFEERITVFGNEAEILLEDILDDWEKYNAQPEFSGYHRDDNNISFLFISGSHTFEQAEMLSKLFQACGADVTYSC